MISTKGEYDNEENGVFGQLYCVATSVHTSSVQYSHSGNRTYIHISFNSIGCQLKKCYLLLLDLFSTLSSALKIEKKRIY